MKDSINRVAMSSQEQAIASWIQYLNQIRFNELMEMLLRQDCNLEEALAELEELKEFIGNPEHILGSMKTKHGEIAEHVDVNISNARNAIIGLKKEYSFENVGRTAPEDYTINGTPVQSKYYNGLSNTFKNGIEKHLEDYPDFIKSGGIYKIPKDQYEQLMKLMRKYSDNPSELSAKEYNLAKEIDEFLKENNITIGKEILPGVGEYAEVQICKVDETIENEEANIKEKDKEQRNRAKQKTKPTLKEGLKAAGVGAATEAGVTFCIAVAKKRKEKEFAEFDEDDWKEIGIDTTKSMVKGGIRGGTIYALTNFTRTPANFASAYVTATFGVVSQIKALEEGKITETDFIINCETVCLDASVSAITSLLGEQIIQIPILGSVIGNVAGCIILDICKQYGTNKSINVLEEYNREINIRQDKNNERLSEILKQITNSLSQYERIERLAFDRNINIAFAGSILLAKQVGVNADYILQNKEQIDHFFMG